MKMWMSRGADTCRDERPTRSSLSGTLKRAAVGDSPVWQWEHKTGFRSYKDHESRRIESAYQMGCENVRLKTGKTNAPMEIFFHDMIQHDPISGNSRRIRRLGREGCCKVVRRKVLRCWRYAAEGSYQRRDFQHYERLKREIRSGVDGKTYSVANYYHANGFCAKIAKSNPFFALTMLVIILNAFWMCVDADREGGRVFSVPAYVRVIENTFCVLFTLELGIRFGAFKRKIDCLKDFWMCFDAALVLVMIIETWIFPLYVMAMQEDSTGSGGVQNLVILRMAKLLRITRLGRIARLLHVMPEAFMLLKGIAKALRSVMVTLLLLIALLLFFGVAFRTHVADDDELISLFPTVGASMWLLLIHGTLLDSPSGLLAKINRSSSSTWFLSAGFMAYIFLSSFTVLNMLVGILVDVVSQVAETEKEQAAVSFLKKSLLDILECHDHDGDRKIQQDEFELLMKNPEVHITLTRFGVDVDDLVSIQEKLFEDKTAGTPWENEGETDDLSLKVTLLSAGDLRAADFRVVNAGKSDPYCVCEIPGKAGTKFRTPTVPQDLDPVWNHGEEIRQFAPGDSLRFTVWDEDWGKEDDFLGRATLPSSAFFPGGFQGELQLSANGGGYMGVLRVKVDTMHCSAVQNCSKQPNLSFSEFLEAVLRLRGGNRATVHDVVELRGLILDRFKRLYDYLEPEHRSHEPRSSDTGTTTGLGGTCTLQDSMPSLPGEVQLDIVQTPFAESRPSPPMRGHPSPSPQTPTEGLAELAAEQRELRAAVERQAAAQEALGSELAGLRSQLSALQQTLAAALPRQHQFGRLEDV